ncbi:ABC transporter ATP-binding protein [Ramlibacter sp. G-1-2-2]|uniref:ABC transporter ATP-binding protein n=1 Tax=Ramlibacter agri TaxID=2728837 RepID=A0A848GZJ5_9BURK|nr:ABC transporter ATP-binding protein [Ramlibacter agri]NML42811.1 ABC transporter ATP-binding protein [Ramlibacter agri]
MNALLDIDAMSVHFKVGGGLLKRGQVLRAVENVTLRIEENETVALVGESGSGKTTLGRVVAGLADPSAGAVRYRGGAVRPAGKVQMIFQDPFSALDPRMLVADIVAEPLRLLGVDAQERRERARALIEQVRLPADAGDRYPHEFSGGQRQRIAIARALVADPELVVADEPLSALDVSIQSQVLNLIAELRETRKLAMLFISHDLGVVHHLADRVAVLYLGRLVEVAKRDDLFARPSHPYTRALLDAAPRIGPRRVPGAGLSLRGEIPSPINPPSGCVFHTRCPKATDLCRTTAPALEPAPGRPVQWAACHHKE